MDVKQGLSKDGKTVLYLVFEYMDTDVKKYIRSFRQTGDNIPPQIVKSLMYQLCKGIAFCHGHGVLHRYIMFTSENDLREKSYYFLLVLLTEILSLTIS